MRLGLKTGYRVGKDKLVQEAKVRQFAGMAVSKATVGRWKLQDSFLYRSMSCLAPRFYSSLWQGLT